MVYDLARLCRSCFMIDGWMTRFFVLLIVFQSFQDDGRVIIKGLYPEPLDRQASAQPAELPGPFVV